jgi:hypothetical protein
MDGETGDGPDAPPCFGKIMHSIVHSGIALATALVCWTTSAQAQTCGFVGSCGDLDKNGSVATSDALRLLRSAVGQPVTLTCECDGEGSATCDEDLAACAADLEECEARPVCGDGIVEEGEDCDNGVPIEATCETLGFEGGDVGCDYCVFDTTACYETRFDGSGPTVIDLETGLEWEKKDASDGAPNYANPHDADNDYTWCRGAATTCDAENSPFDGTIATDFLASLNEGGNCYQDHCDWRLPTLAELQGIGLDQETCQSAPCVAAPALLPMRSNYYWSSTTYALDEAIAWLVNFDDGSSTASYKPASSYVRAVRTASP